MRLRFKSMLSRIIWLPLRCDRNDQLARREDHFSDKHIYDQQLDPILAQEIAEFIQSVIRKFVDILGDFDGIIEQLEALDCVRLQGKLGENALCTRDSSVAGSSVALCSRTNAMRIEVCPDCNQHGVESLWRSKRARHVESWCCWGFGLQRARQSGASG
jgi:hypothetical protein